MTDSPHLSPDDIAELRLLIHHIRRLFHKLQQVAEGLHQEVSAGERGVLVDVVAGPPRTVPGLARERPVSRQHIQKLVQALEQKGLVERSENPAHKTARLVVPSLRGRKLVEEIEHREQMALGLLPLDLRKGELKSAVRTLARLRAALDDSEWVEGLERE